MQRYTGVIEVRQYKVIATFITDSVEPNVTRILREDYREFICDDGCGDADGEFEPTENERSAIIDEILTSVPENFDPEDFE